MWRHAGGARSNRFFRRARSGRALGPILVMVAVSLQCAETHAGALGKLLGAGAAAGAVAARASSKKVYDATTLRPPELQDCLVKAHDIDVLADEVTSTKQVLDKERGLLQKDAISITASNAAAGKGELLDQAAVDKHNGRIRKYKERQKAFNDRVDAANGKVTDLQGRNTTFKAKCAGKRYFASDLNDIRSKLPFDISKVAAVNK